MSNLPDIETVSAAVHSAWMDSKRAQGVESRKAEDGEELMVPYADLTEKAKELDRGTVRAVYAAIQSCEPMPAAPLPDDIRETLGNLDLDLPDLAVVCRHIIGRVEELEQRA